MTGGRRPGAGRKPRAGAPADETLRFRCSEAEAAEIQGACAAAARDLSDVARELLLAWARGTAARDGSTWSQLAGRVASRVEIAALDPGCHGPVMLSVQFSDGGAIAAETDQPIRMCVPTSLGLHGWTFTPVRRGRR
jgi:hypothetical protein